MTQSQLIELAVQIGFDHYGQLNMESLIVLKKVREICMDDRCKLYGHSWSCPPACGTLEFAEKQMQRFSEGILVQTTAHMTDDFDLEAIHLAEKDHKAKFMTLARQARLLEPECLPLSAGSCRICRKCTYPDRPCRYPDRMYPSMEAYGLWVSDVCEKSGLAYNYGKQTVTFTSCILFSEKKS